MPAQYQILASGLYQMMRAEVIVRPFEVGGQTNKKWFTLGDVDSFTLSITPSKISRKRKNAAVRSTAIEVINEIESTISMSCYQYPAFTRALSVLGAQESLTQEAQVSQTLSLEKGYVGGIYWLGALDVSGVTVTTPGESPIVWDADDFKVVDPALGMVQLLSLPSGATDGGPVSFGFAAAEIKASDNRLKARVASETDIHVELMVREVGRNAIPKVLHLYDVTLSPAGDVNFISEDDFTPLEISGTALDTTNGVGVLMDLTD